MRKLIAAIALIIAAGCATPDYSKYTTQALLQDQHDINQTLERVTIQNLSYRPTATDPNTRNIRETTHSISKIKEARLRKKSEAIDDELFKRAQAASLRDQSENDAYTKAMAILNSPPTQPQPIIHSKIKGDFNGWAGDTLFQLANGQVYQQCDSSQYSAYLYRPTCALVPMGNDTYTLVIENIPEYCLVKRLK